MEFITLMIVVTLIHSCIFFFDFFFKSCSMYPYLRFLQGTGLDICLFRVTWFTTAFNRLLQKWGSFRYKIVQQWFNVGVGCTLILLPISVFIVIQSIVNIWSTNVTKTASDSSPVILEPVVPGINLPLSDIGYYISTLCVCSVVHEFGHAIAAVREGVHVAGVGVVIMLFLPIAHVKLNTEQLSALHPRRQLRIYCAGIWHNLILSAAAYAFLIMIPVVFYPVYDIGRGVVVQSIKENSPIFGPTGLNVGDKVAAINDCEVSDEESWRQCLISAVHQSAPGYCVSQDLVHQLDESIPVKHLEGGVVECCNAGSQAHLCFETIEDDSPLEILQYSCLPARTVVAGAAYTCRTPVECPPGLHCMRPVLANDTTLLRIQRFHSSVNKFVVIFLGNPLQVLHTVQVSDFVPIYKLLPSALPQILIHLSKYFVIFSFGLAIINVIPCFYFDGYYILYATLTFFLSTNKKHRTFYQGVALSCNVIGTFLLLFNFFSILWKSVY